MVGYRAVVAGLPTNLCLTWTGCWLRTEPMSRMYLRGGPNLSKVKPVRRREAFLSATNNTHGCTTCFAVNPPCVAWLRLGRVELRKKRAAQVAAGGAAGPQDAGAEADSGAEQAQDASSSKASNAAERAKQDAAAAASGAAQAAPQQLETPVTLAQVVAAPEAARQDIIAKLVKVGRTRACGSQGRCVR